MVHAVERQSPRGLGSAVSPRASYGARHPTARWSRAGYDLSLPRPSVYPAASLVGTFLALSSHGSETLWLLPMIPEVS